MLHHLDQGSGRHLVRGRESVAGTPLVPFAHLIPREDGAEPLEAIAVYSAVPRRLKAAAEHLLVDDAHLLDKASAVLLAQALRAGVPVVLSAPSRSELPSVVADAAREVGLEVITLEPLDDDVLLRLVAVELGGQLAVPDARALIARADGSPGLALALVVAAQDAGRVRSTPGGYRIDGFVVTDRARALAGVDLDALSTEATTALESLVITGRLPAISLSAELGADLARRGLADHAGHELAVAGPLVADLVAEVFTGARARASARSALELIPSTGWDVERRALGVLADVVTDDPATIATAAWLLGRGRPRPALDLLASVAPDVSMLMLRAEAQLETGDVGAAVADLDTAAELAVTDQELLGIARGWTFCLGGNLSDDTDLEDRIRTVPPRFTDEEIRRQVRGALAQRRIVLGSRGTTPDETAHDETAHDETAHHETAPADQVVVALRAAMDGDVTTARAEAAPSVEGWAGDDVEFEEQMRVLAHFLSLVYDGQLVEARDVALTHQQRALVDSRPILGLWSYNRTKICFHAGQYAESAELGEQMRRHLAWRDVTGLALPGDALLAAALARLGRQEEAERLVSGLSPAEQEFPRVRIGVARVEAERLRSTDSAAAAQLLWDAGQHALANEELYSGVLAADESFMLHPNAEAGGFLELLRDRSALVAAFADRATAMLEGDPGALAAAAELLERLVQPGRAAHAWRNAASLHARGGESEAARRCERASARLLTDWEVTTWPDVARDSQTSDRS